MSFYCKNTHSEKYDTPYNLLFLFLNSNWYFKAIYVFLLILFYFILLFYLFIYLFFVTIVLLY